MEDKELGLIEHLDELRKRLIITVASLIVFFIIGFMYVEEIYAWLVRDLDVKLIVLGPSDIVWVYIMLASIIAIAATIPVLATQIWLFVKPALKPNEIKVTLGYIPALFILFVIGIAFGYFVIFPMVLGFLINLGGEMFVTNFTAEKYFRFVMNMTLPFGVLFELPVVVMFLTSLGIVNPYVLSKLRKYAYFVLVFIAIIITPPDFMSDFLVTLPLLLLYEISINLSKIVYKRRMKKAKEWEEKFGGDLDEDDYGDQDTEEESSKSEVK
ncbi:twin-arginine translocase subunit TatC [Bacillus sp. DNRA2]|uniref:twin-arginine translocase subunit TatC n=1 Tax=Bacillus sp. DNRA2 TaxID=2723053 RepID=UPI00145C5B87|nr:twin-arginine translocase subunit TatC [Bacillus sp. DNRA2]NMD72805.1 twin-arginine translocase subunit TatC [Bacillus sp. DNRA2]